MRLFPDQQETIDKLRESLKRKKKAPCVVAPTGSGKTVIAMEIVKRLRDNGMRVLFLAPRRELIQQASKTFDKALIAHGIIMAGEGTTPHMPVQVASFDTLYSRAIRSDIIELPEVDFVFVDEAHLSIPMSRSKILRHYLDNGVRLIGLTATPARGDGRGLGELYDALVMGPTVSELTSIGRLVPVRYFGPAEGHAKLDLSRVKKTSADYVVSSLEKAVDKPKLIGDIYDNWNRIAPDKSTVIFATTVKHSLHICEEFRARGVTCEHVDAMTPLDQRKAIMRRVSRGQTQVLCNVFVASYGLDIPRLECAVLARPTRSIVLYFQTVGRVLRAHPGKHEAIVIDHAGAIDEHGYIDDPVPWTLAPNIDVRKVKQEQKQERGDPKEIHCSQCGTIFRGSRTCPNCGATMIPKGKGIPVHKGKLVEKKDVVSRRHASMPQELKDRCYGGLRGWAAKQGYKEAWALVVFKEIFGEWPAKKFVPMREPDEFTMGQIKHRQIKYAKRRRA